MAGYDTLVALVVQPNAQQLWDAEEYRKLELQSSAPRRTHRVTFFNLALAKHVNILFFQPGVQNVSPQTISASNNLHRVCLRFQLTSRWEMKEVLFSIGNEKAFLVATRSSSSWSRPDLEMQFQTRSIVPNYFERSLPALTRCQYLLLFLLTLKQKLELKLWTARRRGIWR